MNILEEIENYGPYKLSELADCASPDSSTSEGSDFLATVRDDVIDKIQNQIDWDGKLSSLSDLIALERDRIQDEASDSAPDVRTHTMWREYVDLCAYQEDLTEFGTPTDDTMEGRARLALTSIAHRLVSALLDEIEGADK
ncbi:OCR-like antirestriction protein [Streptomyces phage Diane]|uniref:OCR-like antirestriction protein n=1 Tax=Streptomyces phage Diane TaxID=2041207 RepID=A0A291LIE6_9CAUD|nr:hypothetical protein KGG78_gp69 [Streptomyces phage Diane]ATI18853.1 OCR-like antirestriction protein [Streptomyces phage Diane]